MWHVWKQPRLVVRWTITPCFLKTPDSRSHLVVHLQVFASPAEVKPVNPLAARPNVATSYSELDSSEPFRVFTEPFPATNGYVDAPSTQRVAAPKMTPKTFGREGGALGRQPAAGQKRRRADKDV